jgi:hypothetical protein
MTNTLPSAKLQGLTTLQLGAAVVKSELDIPDNSKFSLLNRIMNQGAISTSLEFTVLSEGDDQRHVLKTLHATTKTMGAPECASTSISEIAGISVEGVLNFYLEDHEGQIFGHADCESPYAFKLYIGTILEDDSGQPWFFGISQEKIDERSQRRFDPDADHLADYEFFQIDLATKDVIMTAQFKIPKDLVGTFGDYAINIDGDDRSVAFTAYNQPIRPAADMPYEFHSTVIKAQERIEAINAELKLAAEEASPTAEM